MPERPLRVVSAILFFPRGGSAFNARALARELARRGAGVRLVAGSRHDLPAGGDAREFYAGVDLHEVDFTPALAAPDPMAFTRLPGTAPLQPSYEDRQGAPDRVFAALGEDAFEAQVQAWSRELAAAGAAGADVLHLHHLTPINAAAERAAAGVPVVGQLHGTELLMLEAIAHGVGWRHGDEWAERMRSWAARCESVVVAPGNRDRAIGMLGVEPERIVMLPSGFDPELFRPLERDRDAVWRRVLVDEPRGWAPGGEPGSVRYGAEQVDALANGPVVLYVGRFMQVKRLPLLLDGFADARSRLDGPASLVLVGGHPGEWEGEHPAEAIERLGLEGVMLAGWYEQSELPELLAAGDLLVLPSPNESFGQAIVEAMACGVPAIAADALGPAQIIEDGELGWLFAPDDRRALADALVHALSDPDERARRARRALEQAPRRFGWPVIGERLERILRRAA